MTLVDPTPQEALATWLAACAIAPTATEDVPVEDADGRVLTADIVAVAASPNARVAAMDGYAVAAADSGGAFERIDTGQVVPDRFDCVVPVERAQVDGARLRIDAAPGVGDHVRVPGEDVPLGTLLARAGDRLGPRQLGLLIAGGHTRVGVRRRPVVTVIATGEEIVPAGSVTDPGQTPDANGPLIAAEIARDGGEATRSPIVGDDIDALRHALDTADQSDLILLIAGSSKGRRDRVPDVVSSLGRLVVRGVAARPAHPVALGVIAGRPVVCLPGYPVSCFLAYRSYGRVAIDRLLAYERRRWFVDAQLACDLSVHPGVETTVPVTLRAGLATPLPRRGGALRSLAQADGLITARDDATAGSAVTVELLDTTGCGSVSYP